MSPLRKVAKFSPGENLAEKFQTSPQLQGCCLLRALGISRVANFFPSEIIRGEIIPGRNPHPPCNKVVAQHPINDPDIKETVSIPSSSPARPAMHGQANQQKMRNGTHTHTHTDTHTHTHTHAQSELCAQTSVSGDSSSTTPALQVNGGTVVNASGPWFQALCDSVGVTCSTTSLPTRIQVGHKMIPKEYHNLPFTADGWGASGIYFMPRAANGQLIFGSVAHR